MGNKKYAKDACVDFIIHEVIILYAGHFRTGIIEAAKAVYNSNIIKTIEDTDIEGGLHTQSPDYIFEILLDELGRRPAK